MDKPTTINDNSEVKREWDSLEYQPAGVQNYEILYSAHENLNNITSQGVTESFCKPITLHAVFLISL